MSLISCSIRGSSALLNIHRNINKPWSSLIRAMASSKQPTFETLLFQRPSEFVVNVQLNRPNKRNAMTGEMWQLASSFFYEPFIQPYFWEFWNDYSELRLAFEYLDTDSECRVVLLTGNGPSFCAGLDFQSMGQLGQIAMSEDLDASRKAFEIRRLIEQCQRDFTAIDNCSKPVLCAIHQACVGVSLSLITACDIRYATKDSFYSCREVDLGLSADVGALQRLPSIIGNEGVVRELAYTARQFDAAEALKMGLIAGVFDSQEQMMTAVLKTAVLIAAKSPVAVQGTKLAMNYSRDHSVQEGLDFQRNWNSCHLQSEDLLKSAMAAMQREPLPPYAKL